MSSRQRVPCGICQSCIFFRLFVYCKQIFSFKFLSCKEINIFLDSIAFFAHFTLQAIRLPIVIDYFFLRLNKILILVIRGSIRVDEGMLLISCIELTEYKGTKHVHSSIKKKKHPLARLADLHIMQ